jgi:hypothetical protein
VLDPACGTGNFLYVSMELMKRLEGEALDFLKELGETSEPLRTVDPHQFLGIELNPRAVPIAELVLWIGYLQWWFRTRERQVISEPILKDFGTVRIGDAALAYDKQELLRDERGRPITRQDPHAVKLHPITGEEIPDPDAKLEVYRYVNPRPAQWPEAEFIIGNPPFIGGKDLRAELGDGYTEALWASRGKRSDSIDYVTYWWDSAATLLARTGSKLRRFGFITTNSITQKFSRRVIQKRLQPAPAASSSPLSLVFAIPDHPWQKAPKKAAVRIAMTVAEKGERNGRLAQVVSEGNLETDQPEIAFRIQEGRINADLSVGIDITGIFELEALNGLSSPGVKLHGDGFILTPSQAATLGLGRTANLDTVIKPYLHNRDLKSRPRGVMVIDLFGLSEEQVRKEFPSVYQWLLDRVKPKRDLNHRESYSRLWWVFGEPRAVLRPAVEGLGRIIVTGETSHHRFFEFFPTSTIADNMIRVIASDDVFVLGVLSSQLHTVFSLRKGGWLGQGNDPRYQAECFSTFPFPAATELQQQSIRELAEELDALRKTVLAEHDFLTMTKLYNVREKLQSGAALDGREKAIHDAGCVGVIHELHNKIDAAVAEAYGWPTDLPDEDILSRLVALNKERAEEEKRGIIRWLRPDYQAARARTPAAKALQIEADLELPKAAAPHLPKDDAALVATLRQTLRVIGKPAEAKEIAQRFRDGVRASRRVERGLRLLAAAGVVRRSALGWFLPSNRAA